MKIAFNTANLVARDTGYRFKLSDWGKQHELTARSTDERAWDTICGEIRAAGYDLVEIWMAHIDPTVTNQDRAKSFLRIMNGHGLAACGIAGALNAETARVAEWMGITTFNGGFRREMLPEVQSLCSKHGFYANYENHPERTVEAILAAIDGGSERVGVAVDTGWLGTQGLSAPDVVRRLGPLVRHVHVKDVAHAGAHETTPLGKGIVDLPGTFAALKEAGYTGVYSWEDEPEERNPFDIAAEMRRWIASHAK